MKNVRFFRDAEAGTLVSRGASVLDEVVRTRETGWGVRHGLDNGHGLPKDPRGADAPQHRANWEAASEEGANRSAAVLPSPREMCRATMPCLPNLWPPRDDTVLAIEAALLRGGVLPWCIPAPRKRRLSSRKLPHDTMHAS